MDWIYSFQKAINYIEDNLLENMNIDEIAQRVYSSKFHFQRIFSIITGVGVNEYIRNRRLTLAGQELFALKTKVIDVALKYGYESPESFTKAFTRFHGVTPSLAQKSNEYLKIFSPFKINLTIQGGFNMSRTVNTNSKEVQCEFFKWVDYSEKYEAEIESWENDEEDSIKEIHEYYMEISDGGGIDSYGHDYTWNKTYFGKVVLEETEVIAAVLIMGGDSSKTTYIKEFLVNPKHQNKGYGTKIISELINNVHDIIGFDSNVFTADTFSNNTSMIRVLEKTGFVLAGIHKGGDFTYWICPASERENYRKDSVEEFEKAGYSGDFIAIETIEQIERILAKETQL